MVFMMLKLDSVNTHTGISKTLFLFNSKWPILTKLESILISEEKLPFKKAFNLSFKIFSKSITARWRLSFFFAIMFTIIFDNALDVA